MNYHDMNNTQNINYRKSGFLLAGIVVTIYLFLFIRGTHLPYVLVIAALLTLLSLFNTWPLRQIIEAFIGFGNFMHRFTNPLVFGLIYIVAIVPTSLALKLLGKDVLQLRFDSSATSYWQKRTNGKTWKESFRKQY